MLQIVAHPAWVSLLCTVPWCSQSVTQSLAGGAFRSFYEPPPHPFTPPLAPQKRERQLTDEELCKIIQSLHQGLQLSQWCAIMSQRASRMWMDINGLFNYSSLSSSIQPKKGRHHTMLWIRAKNVFSHTQIRTGFKFGKCARPYSRCITERGHART